jgi:predicted MPP superfamily phosphohydrolase
VNIITILHLSDLHWTETKAKDMQIVIGALCEDLRRLRSDEQITPDLAIFSGDLVQAGEEPAMFVNAHDEFIKPVLTAASLTAERFFIVPGNHDIARSVVREDDILDPSLRSRLTTSNVLNKFIDDLGDGKEINQISLARLKHFEEFIRSADFNIANTWSPLLRTYIVDLPGTKVGIACFNTAWRATGEPDDVDRHRLLLGERNVDNAIAALSEADLRLAVFHHPLDWLAEFDEMSVASRLYSAFDVLMCGHTHRSFPEVRTTSIGTSIMSQTGCLYQARNFFNGYQLLQIDLVSEKAEFIVRTYNDSPRRVFDRATNVAAEGRVSLHFASRSLAPNSTRIERVLREGRPRIRQLAAEHISISDGAPGSRLDVRDVFVCPPLRSGRIRSVPVVSAELDPDRELTVEALIRASSNFIIVGPRESGKSSLAHYMAVLCAEGICDRPRVPVVIDFRQLKLNSHGVRRDIIAYLNEAARRVDLDAALQDGDFIFFVDNFTIRTSAEGAELKKLVEAFSSCRWVCFADAGLGLITQYRDHEFPSDFREVVIEQLPRRSIRELSRRWCEQIEADSDQIFTAVMNQLRRDCLPRTGYIVTLLLWAVYQERRFERINEAVLLTNMIDFLLGKADFQQALRREFDSTSKEITLQSLARFLRDHNGVASVNDVTIYLIAFFQQKGLTYSASDILNKLIECGILCRSGDDISFKYRCFEEYFLACMFRDDPNELDRALEGLRFLEYARELDLLSGLRRRNSDLITIIGNVVAEQAPDDVSRQSLEQFDNIAIAESTLRLSRKKLNDIKKKKVTSEQIDNLADASDRRLARRGASHLSRNTDDNSPSATPAMKMSPVSFSAALDLYGRVIRNSEFTDIAEKEAGTRLYLNNCGKIYLILCEVMSELLSEIKDNPKEFTITLNQNDISAVRYIINKAIFLGFQDKISDELGTEKMFAIYETMLNDPKTSNLEKLMLSMLLLDLRHAHWPDYWTRLIDLNSKGRFVLDLLTDKIWRLIHTRPLPDAERDRLAHITVRIEERFGAPKFVRSSIIANVRRSAAETTRREGS